mgnify:CR=1 FL=1
MQPGRERPWVVKLERLLACAPCACLFLLLGLPASAQNSFDVAARLVSEGDFRGALLAAREAPDALQRSQAELHVFHYAGDLDAALEAGRRGLTQDPKEPWLLEKASYVALSLGLGKPAVAWLKTLEEISPGKAPPWMMEEAEDLQATREAEAAASERARTAVLLGLSAILGCLLYGVLRPGPDGSLRKAPGSREP